MQKDLNWLKKRPIAHRGLHDGNQKIFENSMSAFKGAIDKNYAIECDLHISKDEVPFVFHDDSLLRICGIKGQSRDHEMEQLERIHLGGTQDTIPSLEALLSLTNGRVPLILELKGQKGKDDGFIEAVIDQLKSYEGHVALMSFDHWLVEDMAKYCKAIPYGLTAEGDDRRYDIHKNLYDKVGFDFMSYHVDALPCKIVSEMRKNHHMPIITWTIRDKTQEALSNEYADQVTFELMEPTTK